MLSVLKVLFYIAAIYMILVFDQLTGSEYALSVAITWILIIIYCIIRFGIFGDDP